MVSISRVVLLSVSNALGGKSVVWNFICVKFQWRWISVFGVDGVGKNHWPGTEANLKGFPCHCTSSFSGFILSISVKKIRGVQREEDYFFFVIAISSRCLSFVMGLESMLYFYLWKHISAGLVHLFVFLGVFLCMLFLADWAKTWLHHVPCYKKTKIKEEGNEPIRKKGERKGPCMFKHVEPRRGWMSLVILWVFWLVVYMSTHTQIHPLTIHT